MRAPRAAAASTAAEHGGRPAHVGLHRLHAAGRLERQATGVEGDPFAHQGHVGHPPVALDGIGRPVVDLAPAGAAGPSPGPRRAVHPGALGHDPLLVPHLDRSASATSAKRVDENVGERLGRQRAGRLVDQVAGQADRLGQAGAPPGPVLQLDASSGIHR